MGRIEWTEAKTFVHIIFYVTDIWALLMTQDLFEIRRSMFDKTF